MQAHNAEIVELPVTPAKPRRRANKAAKLAEAAPDFILQGIASGAAAIIPVATYTMSHFELPGFDLFKPETYLPHAPTLALIAAGLAYSAPTVSEWAYLWTGGREKAWAFTILLEGVMTQSRVPVLPLVCLTWLAGINLLVAAVKSGKKKIKIAK